MSFVDREFIYFLLVFALLWHFTRGRYELKIPGMLAMSLLFYGFHRWWLVLLIGAYCIADWAAALAIERTRHKKLALLAGLTFNLGVLAAWKYTPLLIVTINSLTGWKVPGTEAIDGWFIPMGISFYGFSGIAYMVDVYRGVVKAEPNLVRFSLFTTFFPHLVAGPILRAKEFLTHLNPGELPSRPEAPLEGTFLIARGLFKKLVLADSIAIAIDPFFADVSGAATAGVWSLPYVYLYALQIYFDFSGYTDIARGLGLWFGFRWPDNFNWPYLASSVQDFWRRWHMTLSRFLRDYLYIPLGGSKFGALRTLTALMVTMLLGGLWHGASWSFMIWGGLHGLFLCINYLWAKTLLSASLARLKGVSAAIWTTVSIVLTFHAVCFAWIFFRLTSLADIGNCIRKLYEFDADKLFVGGSADVPVWTLLTGYAIATALAVALSRAKPLPEAIPQFERVAFARGAAWGVSAGLLVLTAALHHVGHAPPFIYFQF
ncbi:MAG: MBOAT family protein [Rhizobiales bacterium]|nr:MBOAT family protein [Hyphomicrobiales bacterium]